MKNSFSGASLALALVLLLPSEARSQGQSTEVLNNDAVVQMVTGKVPKALILTKIQSTSTAFDISSKGLVALHTDKVPDDVMKAMMKATTNGDSKEVLTNADVITMVTGGVSKDIILSKIQTTKGQYDLTATGLVNLNQNKVPQDIMTAMLSPKPVPSSTPAPASQAAPATSPPGNAVAAASATPTPAVAATPAAKSSRSVKDGAAATINTTLTVIAATAKVKAYLTSKHIAYTVDKTTGAIVSDWDNDHACAPAPSHCMNRSNTKVVTEGGKVVIHVQVFERKRESGSMSKPWTENPTSLGKETGELADALEAYLAK